jgi:hypothetical protein
VITLAKYHKANKYRNVKTVLDGIKFDSKRESRRYAELKLLLKAKEISGLEVQVKFVLIPAMRIHGVMQRAVTYTADFRYTDKYGKVFIEDSKGLSTQVFKIKHRLMKQVHGIEVVLV